MRYFSADFHLGSTLINKYARRPWATAHEAGLGIISNMNNVCSSDDVLVHCGDFSLQSADRHGAVVDIPIEKSVREWIWSFKPTVVLLQGNHDEINKCECVARSMVVDLDSKWCGVYVSHYPSDHDEYRGPVSVARRWRACDGCTDQHESYSFAGKLSKGQRRPAVALCGHVHDTWLVKFDSDAGVLNVNVGVDVWGYKPVSAAQIVKVLDFVKSQQIRKLNRTFAWTRSDFERAVNESRRDRKADKARRREEKLKRKGISPEECERRKRDAIEKKLRKSKYTGKPGFVKNAFDAVKKRF